MDDWIGIIIFLVFIGASMLKRAGQATKQQGEAQAPEAPRRRPLPPRPVAPLPRQERRPQPAWPQLPGAPAPQPTRVEPARLEVQDEEGIWGGAGTLGGESALGGEGVWGGEGPAPSERLSEGIASFEGQSARFQEQGLQADSLNAAFVDASEQMRDRRIEQRWAEDLSPLDEAVIARERFVQVDIAQAVRNRDAMAQAVVLAEVLGRPKALRGRQPGWRR